MFSGSRERIVIAAALVVAAVALVVLFGRSTPPPMVGVLFVTEPWPRGGTAASAVLDVPEQLAPLLVAADELDDRVAAIDIPANTFLTPEMLRPPGPELDQADGLGVIRLEVGIRLWPLPGPFAGDLAVIGPTGSACALVVTELLDVDRENGAVTVAVDPEAAARLISAADPEIWPPAKGDWPDCPPGAGSPILETPAGTARLRLVVGVERWPSPGPAAGDLAVVGPAARACALVVTRILAVGGEGEVTIAATPATASRLASAGALSVWPPGAAVWPSCYPVLPEGVAPVRLLVDTTYWPPPGPADGDLAVIGPPGAGCAWLVTNLLRADDISVTVAVTPDIASRLMAEPLPAVWSPTTEGIWPYCDDVPAETVTAPVPAGSALACAGAGRTWNPDTRQCEDL